MVNAPEVKALPSGISVASFSLATNRTYKDKDGNRKEQVEFHNIVVFGAQADACAQFLKKGQIAAVVGRLQTRSWEKDGVKQYRTEIIADHVEFGPRSQKTAEEPVIDADTASPRPDYYPAEDINPDDIPF